MTPERALYIERANCRRKACFDEAGARRAARRRSTRGDRLRAYPCPIRLEGQGPHWHIGHPPTLAVLERLALALRAQKGEL